MITRIYLLIILILLTCLHAEIKTTTSASAHEPGYVPSSPRSINIYAHIIRTSQEEEGISIENMNTSIEQLNEQFSDNSAMLVFEINGIEYIDNDDYVFIIDFHGIIKPILYE